MIPPRHLLPLVVLLVLDSAVPLPMGESQRDVAAVTDAPDAPDATEGSNVTETYMSETDTPVATTPESDGKILHRTKRGWMWNTFVVMEEYTGSLDQYVGKVRIVCVCVCV